MFNLSNTEFMLLSLIRERKAASGYQLNTIIKNRGYRQWADVGMTSIYRGLKKLEQKGLIQGQLTTNKTIQGPAAKEYFLTDEGVNMLKEETGKGLSETRERDRRFDLALSTMDVLSSETALSLFFKRMQFLESEQKRISKVYSGQQQQISFQGALLFKHTLHFIKSEITFLNNLINNWEKETVNDDHKKF
ncbi:PadR family transcriptional regulator [Candidatus Contubernalis alkaliaceticus]|uniref:PadR family transcriptional regulator n=1 Tax=Candidatus Contubernalis alkaliaceticus TaxID=338645 RepID=UPI001F4BFE02|nr:PadR family transcriptional regulator [Candidatus Contubernalis alkalaceticus]UNC90815.1 PadR family transcriptional regulator [Candidatus Contubernalis alkalaceticus]